MGPEWSPRRPGGTGVRPAPALAPVGRAEPSAARVLALQRATGNRGVGRTLARQPVDEAAWLDVKPTGGRLHLPDIVLKTWADEGQKDAKGLPLEGAVLNSLKFINPTLRLSLVNQRLSGRGVLSWDTGNPFASPTEVDLDVALWRKKGTLRFDATASAMGLEGEVNLRVNLPRHQDGDLEALWKDLEAAIRKAVPALQPAAVKAEVEQLLDQVLRGELDSAGFVKALTAAVKRLTTKGTDTKALEKALWTALSQVLPKIDAKIRVRAGGVTIAGGGGGARVTPEGPKADLTVGGIIVAPPGKVSSTLAPVLGVYGERLELGKRISFQAGLLQKLDPDAFSKPGAGLTDKLPTALYGEYSYTRYTEKGYELKVTFSLKLSTDEVFGGAAPPDPLSDRVRDSLKPGGGRDRYGREPIGGDVPMNAGVTFSMTHDWLGSK